MDCAVNQRFNLSERNCINLCERYRTGQVLQSLVSLAIVFVQNIIELQTKDPLLYIMYS